MRSAAPYLLGGATIGLVLPIAAYVEATARGGIDDGWLFLWPGAILTTGLHAATPTHVAALVVGLAVASNVILYTLLGLGVWGLRRIIARAS